MKNILRVIGILLVLVSSAGSASAEVSDVESLGALFERSFSSGYEPGRCQYNIRAFTAAARSRGIDLSGALYLTFTGYGDIWYYNGRSRSGEPSSGVWFHHYVLAVPTDGMGDADFSPERNYVVMDFDFGNEPELVPLKAYMRDMFIPNSARSDDSRIDQDFSLGLIKVTAHDANYLAGRLLESGEFPRGEESRATVFKELRFREFYRSL